MFRFEFRIIEKLSSGLMVGFSFYPIDEENDFVELNIYLLVIVLHFKFYY